jgi:hypothetical protein
VLTEVTTVQSAMKYDDNLQMYCEPVREPRLAHLQFLRWLAEHGKLEHEIVGLATGEYVGGADEL